MIKKQINLDISSYQTKNKLEELDCGWFDLNSIKEFRDQLCQDLIPIIRINELGQNGENPNVNLSINIFFKWFSVSLIDLFTALKIKNYFKNQEVLIPEKFIFFNEIYNDRIPKTTFQNLKNPYLKQSKIEKFLKNFLRTLQINSLTDFFNFSKISRSILYTNFLKKNLRKNGELNIYNDLSYYFMQTKGDEFSFFDEQNNSLSPKNYAQYIEIKEKIIKLFDRLELKLSNNNIQFIRNLIYHSFLFLKYNWIEKKIPKILHVGTAGSLPWGKLLCALVILKGGRVINYEHGRGSILHFFIQKFFTDINFSSEFVNINYMHKEMNKKRYDSFKKFYLLHNFDVKISFPQKKIINPFEMKKKTFERIKKKELKALYVMGPYLGYSSAFRPFLPDIHYLKFQTKIFDLLNTNKIDFFLKPHPGTKSMISKGMINEYKLNILTENYEKVVQDLDFDFFILDHIASTTAPHIINFSKPTVYFDFNFTEINDLLRKELEESIKIIPVEQKKNGKFNFDSILFKNFIDNIKSNNHINWHRNILKYYE